jgi:hypothetical protein
MSADIFMYAYIREVIYIVNRIYIILISLTPKSLPPGSAGAVILNGIILYLGALPGEYKWGIDISPGEYK